MSEMGRDFRTRCVRIATFVGGLYFFIYFVLPQSVVSQIGLDTLDEPISNGLSIVGTMAFGLGLLNIIAAHGSRVAFRRSGWFYSLALLVGLVSTVVITAAQWRGSVATSGEIRAVQVVGEFATRIKEDAGSAKIKTGGVPPLPTRVAALHTYAGSQLAMIRESLENAASRDLRDAGTNQLIKELHDELNLFSGLILELRAEEISSAEITPRLAALLERISQDSAKISSMYALIVRADRSHMLSQRLYDVLYNGLFNQLGSAMFALLGVYIAAAAYRAFRIRSVESALMMGAALVVMLGQISFGRMLSHDLPAMRQWLLEVPNSAAFRAIRLGAGVAGLMLAIRMWLSIESSPVSSERKKS